RLFLRATHGPAVAARGPPRREPPEEWPPSGGWARQHAGGLCPGAVGGAAGARPGQRQRRGRGRRAAVSARRCPAPDGLLRGRGPRGALGGAARRRDVAPEGRRELQLRGDLAVVARHAERRHGWGALRPERALCACRGPPPDRRHLADARGRADRRRVPRGAAAPSLAPGPALRHVQRVCPGETRLQRGRGDRRGGGLLAAVRAAAVRPPERGLARGGAGSPLQRSPSSDVRPGVRSRRRRPVPGDAHARSGPALRPGGPVDPRRAVPLLPQGRVHRRLPALAAAGPRGEPVAGGGPGPAAVGVPALPAQRRLLRRPLRLEPRGRARPRVGGGRAVAPGPLAGEGAPALPGRGAAAGGV
ncbi:unnamed protein product, partial [Prorocentrum cordatum]